MLGDIAQNQIRRDRRDLVKPRLAELSLDIVFAGEAKTAVKLETGVCGLPTRLGGEIFRHIGLGATRLLGVIEAAGFEAHQVGGFDLDMTFGNGKLHALILSDGLVEYDALLGVGDNFVNEPVAVADAFSRDEGTLRIEARQDVLETLSL